MRSYLQIAGVFFFWKAPIYPERLMDWFSRFFTWHENVALADKESLQLCRCWNLCHRHVVLTFSPKKSPAWRDPCYFVKSNCCFWQQPLRKKEKNHVILVANVCSIQGERAIGFWNAVRYSQFKSELHSRTQFAIQNFY